jgi:hypothetical protein
MRVEAQLVVMYITVKRFEPKLKRTDRYQKITSKGKGKGFPLQA